MLEMHAIVTVFKSFSFIRNHPSVDLHKIFCPKPMHLFSLDISKNAQKTFDRDIEKDGSNIICF